MKIVINTCFGGYSLSYLAVKRLAELNGKECYAFEQSFSKPYTLIKNPEKSSLFTSYFSTNDEELVNKICNSDNWSAMTDDEKEAYNNEYDKYSLDTRPDDRTSPLLIQVIEELGVLANGSCANLKVVEIPDGIDYYIHDYDGNESIHETHNSWP